MGNLLQYYYVDFVDILYAPPKTWDKAGLANT